MQTTNLSVLDIPTLTINTPTQLLRIFKANIVYECV